MQIDRHTLIRYFLGQSPAEEKEAIRQWLETDEANKQQFIRERIRFDASVIADENKIQTQQRFRINRYVLWGLKVAASILILLGSIFAFDTYRMSQLTNTFQCVRAPAGNRTNIILSDGTEVWLNANTSLQYPAVFSKDYRVVVLDGEGYFNVTKSEKPFIVKTNKYDVEVLGTTFDVEAYSNKPDFKTALFTGKVKLYNTSSEAIYLQPGQTAELVDNALKVSPTGSENIYRWREGLIYIEDKSFDEIMQLFENYYNIEIVVKNDKVKELGYSGKLRISDGVDHAFRVMQNDFPFTYERDEDSDTIYIY